MASAFPPTSLREGSSGTLSAKIIDHIRDRLFTGQLKPGERLGGEASLAESFGVSRMAMRDAIRTLAAIGVIEVRRGAGGGVRVASADPMRFADALAIQLTLLGVSRGDLIEAQIAIEAMITRLAAERAVPANVAQLSALLTEAGSFAADSMLFAQAIAMFHKELARIAGNPALAVMLGGILQSLKAVYVGDTTPERAAGVLQRYRNVVAAIMQSDGDLAAARMRAHLANVLAFTRPEMLAPQST